MTSTRFDTISKLFADRRLSRRQAVRQGAAGLAAGTLGVAALKASGVAAQDATPSGSDAATPAAAWDGEKVSYLFVQSFEGGTIAPKDGEDGGYTVTLNHGLGQTLYFSDRPARDVGAAPTAQFLQGLGFPDDNPPNAALVVDDGNGGTNIAVVELRNPVYDETSHTATYDVAVLADWQASTDLGLQEEPADLSALPANLGPTHLFIDDCADDYIYCQGKDAEPIDFHEWAWGPMPFCYNYLACIPCEPYGHTQPDRCSTAYYWDAFCNDNSNDLHCNYSDCIAVFDARFFIGCGS